MKETGKRKQSEEMKETGKRKQRGNLPAGLTLQNEDSLPVNYSYGKVFCDRIDCDECKYIQNIDITFI